MSWPHGESSGREGLDQDTPCIPTRQLGLDVNRILERFRSERVVRPLHTTRAWSRPKITGFDPVKAKRAYDAWQRVKDAYRADNPPVFKARLAEFCELFEVFFSA